MFSEIIQTFYLQGAIGIGKLFICCEMNGLPISWNKIEIIIGEGSAGPGEIDMDKPGRNLRAQYKLITIGGLCH